MKMFHLHRISDETGKSGEGIVAEGVEFTDGKVAMRWMSNYPSWTLFDDMKSLETIHGHEGKTAIIWKG